jgi:hypothetical protein
MRKVLVGLSVLGFVLPSCGDDAGPGSAGGTTTTLAATTATSSATTTATAKPVTLKCQSVGFTPNSEDGAFDVMATGLSCADAEAFVRVAGARTSSGGPPELDVSGYHCVRTRSEQDPLPQAFYECTDGPRKVTFVRS